MIEIFKTKDGNLEQIENVEKDCWISMTNPTPQEVHQIASMCSVEEDVLKAALDAEERARIEIEDDYTLMIVDIPATEKEIVEKQEKDRFITMPLAIVHLDDYIITVCLVESPVLAQLRTGRIKGFSTHKKTRFILQIFFFFFSLTAQNAVLIFLISYHQTHNEDLGDPYIGIVVQDYLHTGSVIHLSENVTAGSQQCGEGSLTLTVDHCKQQYKQ